LGITGICVLDHDGVMPSPEKSDAKGRRDLAHLRQMRHQFGLGLMHVSTGAPDSSNCPPGSSEIAPPPVTSYSR